MIERSILDAASRLRGPYVVATVVAVHGASDHRLGERMILRDRRLTPRTIRDGDVDVLFERSGARIDPIALAADLVAAQRIGAVATVIRSADPSVRVGARVALAEVAIADGIDGALHDQIVADLETAVATRASSNRRYGNIDVFVEALVPPPRLFVFGNGHELFAIARRLGWTTIACTPQDPTLPFVEVDEQLVGGDPRACIDAAVTPIVIVISDDETATLLHDAA